MYINVCINICKFIMKSSTNWAVEDCIYSIYLPSLFRYTECLVIPIQTRLSHQKKEINYQQVWRSIPGVVQGWDSIYKWPLYRSRANCRHAWGKQIRQSCNYQQQYVAMLSIAMCYLCQAVIMIFPYLKFYVSPHSLLLSTKLSCSGNNFSLYPDPVKCCLFLQLNQAYINRF